MPVITEAAHEVHLQPERDKMWVSETHGPGQARSLALHTMPRHMQKKVYISEGERSEDALETHAR